MNTHQCYTLQYVFLSPLTFWWVCTKYHCYYLFSYIVFRIKHLIHRGTVWFGHVSDWFRKQPLTRPLHLLNSGIMFQICSYFHSPNSKLPATSPCNAQHFQFHLAQVLYSQPLENLDNYICLNQIKSCQFLSIQSKSKAI